VIERPTATPTTVTLRRGGMSIINNYPELGKSVAMLTFFFVAGLIVLLVFAFGVLVGHSAAEQFYTQRSRRQAAMQANLNEQWCVLEASWEAMNRLLQENHQPTGQRVISIKILHYPPSTTRYGNQHS